METYKIKNTTKNGILFQNGITTVDVDDGRFLQYNDYFKHKTFYQCPKCKSLNNDFEKDYLDNLPSVIIRICEDCGYQHTTDLMEVNND